jgi:hypothetical protein
MSYSGRYFNNEVQKLGAAVGIAVTTTAGFTAFPNNTQYVALDPYNYASSAAVAMVRFCPYLVVLKTTDDFATAPTDYSGNAQDGVATNQVDLDSLNTLANGDALYVGSHVQFAGVNVDVDGSHPNGTSSVLTVKYYDGTSGSEVWTDTSDTDGTISSGKTMGQDGSVTWSVPSAWSKASLRDIASKNVAGGQPVPATVNFRHVNTALYWTRWEVGTTLDSDTLVTAMLAIGRGNPFELVTGRTWEQGLRKEVGGYAGVELDADTGTLNMVTTVGSGSGHFA